jgi:hypothetical protein
VNGGHGLRMIAVRRDGLMWHGSAVWHR